MSDFENLLKELRAEYLNSIPSKIALIRQQVTQNALPELQDSFHKLKGTGQTYGLPEVTVLAEVLESLCKAGHPQAVPQAQVASDLLTSIYEARRETLTFALESDPRFLALQKLLPK